MVAVTHQGGMYSTVTYSQTPHDVGSYAVFACGGFDQNHDTEITFNGALSDTDNIDENDGNGEYMLFACATGGQWMGLNPADGSAALVTSLDCHGCCN